MKRIDELGREYDETGALWIDGVRAFMNGKVTADYLGYLRLRITDFERQTRLLEEQIATLKWALDHPTLTGVTSIDLANAMNAKAEHLRLVRSLRWAIIRRLEFCTLECSDQVISA